MLENIFLVVSCLCTTKDTKITKKEEKKLRDLRVLRGAILY